MSKSTNTVVYFDWKTVIYIYVCGKCRTQFMLPMEKSVTFTGACANEIIPSINRSFVYKAKEGRDVRIDFKQRILHYLRVICITWYVQWLVRCVNYAAQPDVLTEVVNLIAVHCKVYSIKYYMLKVCQQIWIFSQGISLRGVLDKIWYVKSWSASWFFPQGIPSIKMPATIVLKMSNTDPNKKNRKWR